jgi:long-chain acyl-CoA synthetase
MSSYRDRPWLASYEPGLPGEIAPAFANALEMFESTVKSASERPFIH